MAQVILNRALVNTNPCQTARENAGQLTSIEAAFPLIHNIVRRHIPDELDEDYKFRLCPRDVGDVVEGVLSALGISYNYQSGDTRWRDYEAERVAAMRNWHER